ADVERARPEDFRPLARREIRRDRRDDRPSLVSRRAVPPRVQVEADQTASPVRGVRRRGVETQDGRRGARRRDGVGRVTTYPTNPPDPTRSAQLSATPPRRADPPAATRPARPIMAP